MVIGTKQRVGAARAGQAAPVGRGVAQTAPATTRTHTPPDVRGRPLLGTVLKTSRLVPTPVHLLPNFKDLAVSAVNTESAQFLGPKKPWPCVTQMHFAVLSERNARLFLPCRLRQGRQRLPLKTA